MKTTLVRIVAIALVLVSILTVCAPAFAVTGISKNAIAVTTKEARLRKTADKNSTCLATLSKNTEVTILTTTNTYHGWYKVKYNGKTGYIREDFLKKKTGGGSSSDLPQEIIDWYGKANLQYGSKGQYVKQMLSDIESWAKSVGKGNLPMFKDLVKNCTFNNVVTFEVLAQAALKEYQKCNGLTSDGIFGPNSKTKLYNFIHNR